MFVKRDGNWKKIYNTIRNKNKNDKIILITRFVSAISEYILFHNIIIIIYKIGNKLFCSSLVKLVRFIIASREARTRDLFYLANINNIHNIKICICVNIIISRGID